MRAVLPAPDARGRPAVGEVAEPVAGAGEVLVAVRATAINHADLLQLAGRYPPPPEEPEVPGLECAGEILEIGPGVAGWRPGDRVMALLAGGGHAERAAVPAGQLLALPDGLSWTDGAALPEAALTAWTNLVGEAALAPGERVLVTGATGGVGSFAVQLARELGAVPIAAGRDPGRLERLAALGAAAALPDDGELPERVRRATGGAGVEVVFDLVGGSRLGDHLACLAPGGRLVLLGLLAGARAEVDLGLVLGRRLRIVGSVLRPRPRPEKAALVRAFGEFAAERLADGRLAAVVDRVLPFERIAEAYAALAAGGLFGKIVVEVASDEAETDPPPRRPRGGPARTEPVRDRSALKRSTQGLAGARVRQASAVRPRNPPQ